MHERYLRMPSRHLGREVHIWTFGHFGQPILVFPSAAGIAHEWRASGAVEALRPLIEAGRIKLYCPESNASETWAADGPPWERHRRHQAYERFLIEELVPWIRWDCRTPDIRLQTAGVSLGALYASTMALKHPELFHSALCLSGRYDAQRMLDGWCDEQAYFDLPFAFVPNLHGAALQRIRALTHLTVVIGLGPHEGACIPETSVFAALLRRAGIPHELDVWGHDSAHHWRWWVRQLQHHLGRRYG